MEFGALIALEIVVRLVLAFGSLFLMILGASRETWPGTIGACAACAAFWAILLVPV